MRRTVVRPVLSAAALLLALPALAACGGDEDESARESTPSVRTEQPADDADENAGDSTVIDTGDEQIAVGDDVELPDEFPDDVALPIGEHTITGSTVRGDEVALILASPVEFEIDAEKAHLVESLEDEGWTLEDPMTLNSGGLSQLLLEATKDDRRLTVALVNMDQQGTGTYTVAPAS